MKNTRSKIARSTQKRLAGALTGFVLMAVVVPATALGDLLAEGADAESRICTALNLAYTMELVYRNELEQVRRATERQIQATPQLRFWRHQLDIAIQNRDTALELDDAIASSIELVEGCQIAHAGSAENGTNAESQISAALYLANIETLAYQHALEKRIHDLEEAEDTSDRRFISRLGIELATARRKLAAARNLENSIDAAMNLIEQLTASGFQN